MGSIQTYFPNYSKIRLRLYLKVPRNIFHQWIPERFVSPSNPGRSLGFILKFIQNCFQKCGQRFHKSVIIWTFLFCFIYNKSLKVEKTEGCKTNGRKDNRLKNKKEGINVRKYIFIERPFAILTFCPFDVLSIRPFVHKSIWLIDYEYYVVHSVLFHVPNFNSPIRRWWVPETLVGMTTFKFAKKKLYYINIIILISETNRNSFRNKR